LPPLAVLLATLALAAAEPSAPPPPDAAPRVLGVYPHRLGWDDDAIAAALTEDAVAAARRGRLEVLPPSGFHVADLASPNVLAGSDLARAVAERGLPPRSFVVLRGATERRITRTVRQATDGRETRSSMDEETTWRVRVEVLGPDADAPLVEVRGEAVRRGEVPAGAPAPELRQLHARLVAEALSALERRLAQPAGPPR
jgi:hypothetical protein